MEACAGKSFQMQIIFNIFPRKLVPVQYWEYEYGLLHLIKDKYTFNLVQWLIINTNRKSMTCKAYKWSIINVNWQTLLFLE